MVPFVVPSICGSSWTKDTWRQAAAPQLHVTHQRYAGHQLVVEDVWESAEPAHRGQQRLLGAHEGHAVPDEDGGTQQPLVHPRR